MASITDLIKELRVKTGAGFLDCKKSLEENNNNIEKSIENLRKKGLAKASKKSDRTAIEGAVGIYSNKYNVTKLDILRYKETFFEFFGYNAEHIMFENAKLNSTTKQFCRDKNLKIKRFSFRIN